MEVYTFQKSQELPKLFAMETMVASQSGFVYDATPVERMLGLSMIGGSPTLTIPTLEGYNYIFQEE